MNREFSLYIVATPIGNLDDITIRALECLKKVDFILCEDTRNSIKLLNHFDIKSRLISYHKFNENEISDNIINRLLNGETAALISDAGTPLISDPGSVIVNKLIENNIDFCVLPGANALLPAMILSGLSTKEFTFAGFLPKKSSDRIKALEHYLQSTTPVIMYISPHELLKVLKDIDNIDSHRTLSLSKEITKLYEHTYRGCASEIIKILPDEIKGEFALVIDKSPIKESKILTSNEDITAYFNQLVKEGTDRKTALEQVCSMTDRPKKEIYSLVMRK